MRLNAYPRVVTAIDSLNRYGSQVFVSRIDPLQGPEPKRGSVVKIRAAEIDLSFDEHFDDLEEGHWRYDFHANITSFFAG